MTNPSEALETAVGALERLSASAAGARGSRASVVALVLRTLEETAAGADPARFIARRAEVEVRKITGGPERAILTRLLACSASDGVRVAQLLSDYSAILEESGRLDEASAVIDLACSMAPTCAAVALRAGRIARLRGQGEQALEHYRRAGELDADDGALARMAAIGVAAVAADPVRALGKAKRVAVRAGDGEAAAVAHEERARVRRLRGDRAGAVRDLALAAARYGDPIDRARIAHQIADVFVAAGDPAAAREALLFALEVGDSSQRDHAVARLHTIAREMNDQLGMRRWRSKSPPPFVSLTGRPSVRTEEPRATSVARWRERLLASIG